MMFEKTGKSETRKSTVAYIISNMRTKASRAYISWRGKSNTVVTK